MTTSAVYPPRAAIALGVLKQNANDIDIYVEDTASPNIWLKMLRNFLPDSIKLSSVNCMGGRQGVLDACKADQATDGRRKLYIIDSDFDLLIGRRKPNLKHLYRLRSYCLENYLLQEDSLVDVVTTLKPSISEADVRTTLNYEDWLQRNSNCLRRIFVCYALAEQLELGIATVSQNSIPLLESLSNSHDYCPSKVFVRTLHIYRESVRRSPAGQRREVYRALKAKSGKVSVSRYVSGKDYMLPIVLRCLRSMFRIQQSKDALRCLLAERVKPSTDRYLQRRLAAICS